MDALASYKISFPSFPTSVFPNHTEFLAIVPEFLGFILQQFKFNLPFPALEMGYK